MLELGLGLVLGLPIFDFALFWAEQLIFYLGLGPMIVCGFNLILFLWMSDNIILSPAFQDQFQEIVIRKERC